MPRKKTPKAPTLGPPDTRRSVTFASDTLRLLERLAKDASDERHRTTSASAVIRALIRHAAAQPSEWLREALCPFLDAEVLAGVKWGHESTKFFTER